MSFEAPPNTPVIVTPANESFARIIELGLHDMKPLGSMGLKLMEEVGEFAETLNHRLGYLPHKTMKETPFGEAADVIQNVFACLAKAYPQLSPSQIIHEVEHQLVVKTDKWQRIMVETGMFDVHVVIDQ